MAIVSNTENNATSATLAVAPVALPGVAPVADATPAQTVPVVATPAPTVVDAVAAPVAAPVVGSDSNTANVDQPTDADPQAGATATEAGADTALSQADKVAAQIAAKRKQAAKLLEDADKLEAKHRALTLMESVKAGSVIKARVGRAATSREVEAVVTGVQILESGDRRLKISYGEGFDADVAVIQDNQIIDIVSQ